MTKFQVGDKVEYSGKSKSIPVGLKGEVKRILAATRSQNYYVTFEDGQEGRVAEGALKLAEEPQEILPIGQNLIDMMKHSVEHIAASWRRVCTNMFNAASVAAALA